MLCDLTEDILTDAGLERRIPAWGTMTGVRPTKIPMNQLLQGKEKQEVEEQMRKWYCCTNEKLQLGLQIAIKEAALLKDISFEGGYSLYIGIPFCPTTCLYCLSIRKIRLFGRCVCESTEKRDYSSFKRV